ncbi:MAG: RcnB family protein [Parasphingopyxis sp.]|uniref:RcnB family protein n=1 Tax=Parasphingopyxis sp. TaxID=1920299 RepID=UPI003F9F50B2
MSLTMMPATAQAQSDSGASNAGIAVATQAMRGGHRGGTRVWRGGGRHFVRHGGGRHFVHRGGGRFFHHGGRRFHSGSRFFVGGFLPSYFLAPRYYVVNYPSYGLARPAYGYRWVRYYDDAYLVDGRGHIADGRYGVRYGDDYRDDRRYDDRYYDERYDDDRRYYDDRRRGDAGDAAAGAIVGGIVGGIAGNRIAGRGNRTEGTIIGGALGAIAGGAIGSAAGRSDGYDDRYYRDDRRADRRYYDDRVPEYVGQGDYYPPAAPGYGVDYDYDYQRDDRVVSPPVHHVPPVQTHVAVSGPGTYAVNHANGVSQSATTTIVLNSAPATTTTTTFIEEEVEYVVPRRSTRRAAHRPRSRNCNCR